MFPDVGLKLYSSWNCPASRFFYFRFGWETIENHGLLSKFSVLARF